MREKVASSVLFKEKRERGLKALNCHRRSAFHSLARDFQIGSPKLAPFHKLAFFDDIRTYAVARLCANVACSNPANSALGPARNCCMAGRMISSLVSNQLVPVVIR